MSERDDEFLCMRKEKSFYEWERGVFVNGREGFS
jgi:hypothetical protein